MFVSTRARWTLVVAANVVAWCMLGLMRQTDAQPPSTGAPFTDAVEQRNEIISQLKQLNGLVKEQNALLRSGQLHVVLSDKKK